jgi:hypothetical protein
MSKKSIYKLKIFYYESKWKSFGTRGCWTNISDCKWDRHLDDYNNYVKSTINIIWAH